MKQFLAHLFIPTVSNNFRSRILHHQIISLFILFFFFAGFLTYFVRDNYPSILGISSDISLEQLLLVTNQKRQENGLSPLSLNSQLSQAAIGKGNDMLAKNYWSHISPDGTTPWVFIKNTGYNYTYAGENLARGYTTSEDVVNAWMNSQTHKENMLSSKYTDVGFAVVTGNLTGEETVLVVEMFGNTALAGAPSEAQKTVVQIPTVSPTSVPVVNQSLLLTLTPSPSLIPSQVPVSQTPVNNQLAQQVLTRNSNLLLQPLINGATFSANITQALVSVLAFVFLLDMIVIERKKILRFVGHNLDHVLFMGLILGLVLIIMKGSVI